MPALAVWLLAVGVADLFAGPRGRWDGNSPVRPAWASLALVVTAATVALSLGLRLSETALLTAIVAGTGGAWLWLRHAGAELAALLVLSASLLGFLATTGLWPPMEGLVFAALERSALTGGTSDPETLLLVVGLGTFLLATSNAVVRVVLGRVERVALEQEENLKGGRVIGPLERLLIFGLGVSGQLTAAGLVVAAKSLLRYGEVRGHRGQHQPSVEASSRAELMSEYLLVGSLLSWTVALAAVGIVAATTA